MDWKKTFNHGQWIIHGLLAVFIIVSSGITLYAYRLHHLQMNEDQRVSKIQSIIEKSRSTDNFNTIANHLSWAESDKANEEFRLITQRIATLEELVELKASEKLRKSLRSFNDLINNNAGMSDPSDALKIFNSKVKSLNDFAKSKDYNSVGTISLRMLDRLSNLNGKNVGNSPLLGLIVEDQKRLVQIVSRSKLTDIEKNDLNNKFDSMKTELDLLNNLNQQSKSFKKDTTDAEIAFTDWLLGVEEKSQNFKEIISQKHTFLMIALSGLISLTAISWIGLAYFFRSQRKRIEDQVENEVKNVIEKGIMGDQRFMIDHYSLETREKIVRLLDELKVKLNLGSLLHEGLPFAGCMIDPNFRITWNNNLFLEQLYLSDEEVRSDAFNWDYVREYLNLDEDPIHEALVNQVAGIYPVKVKQDEFTPAQPYEMYVTPLTVNRETRVMVFFYPLVSVKEAINEQVDLTKNAISQFIHSWNDQKLNEDELKLLERNFENNDISDLYKELKYIFTRIEGEKSECLHVINELEKENTFLSDELRLFEEAELNKRKIIRGEVRAANELKDSFIKTIEKSDNLLQINKLVLQQCDDFKTEAVKMQQNSIVEAKKHKESKDLLGQLDLVKVDYKKLKLELLEIKAKLISLNSSLFAQIPALDESQQKLATRYKDELARLDFNVVTLDKKLSQLDVLLSKLMMINDQNQLDQISFKFNNPQKDHELRESIMEIQKILNTEEGLVLENFKKLHTLMKQNLAPVQRIVSSAESTDEKNLAQ